MSGSHEEALRDIRYNNPVRGLIPFHILTVEEFRSLSMNEEVSRIEDSKLQRVLIQPVESMIQNEYVIDQRNYSDSTVPSLSDLRSDFKTATAIFVDFLGSNLDFIVGSQSVTGVGSHNHSFKMPPTARAIMEKYRTTSGDAFIR